MPRGVLLPPGEGEIPTDGWHSRKAWGPASIEGRNIPPSPDHAVLHRQPAFKAPSPGQSFPCLRRPIAVK